MNFLKNYETKKQEMREVKDETRFEIKERVRAALSNFKVTMVTLLNNTGKAELVINQVGAAGVMSRKELGEHITDTITDMLDKMNVECDVYFRTIMDENFENITVEFSVYEQNGGVKNSRRYTYDHKTKTAKDLSASATKAAMISYVPRQATS